MFFSSFISEETSSAENTVRVRGLRAGWLVSSILGVVSLAGTARCGFAATDAKPDKERVVESYGKVPLSFEPNRGQTSSVVQWIARGPEYSLFLSGHDAVLELNSITPAKGITDRPKIDSSAVRMNLVGATSALRAGGEGQQAGTANYFTGNDPAKWQREVPNFEKVRLSGVYPGIDLVYYGRQGRLEYDFVVAPGADASKIALKFDGAEARLAGNGDLVLPVTGTAREMRFDRPTVYQMKDGRRRPVEGAFHLASDRTVSFELGSYDRRRELVIDPTLLFAGSLATGNQPTIPQGMTIDSTGAMYITGYTNDLTFPVTTGALQTNCSSATDPLVLNGQVRCGASSGPSAFVTKLSADGTMLIYSTYLHGGGGYEQGQSIAVDAGGDAYVLGSTSSNDFPITANAYQTYCQPTHQFLSDNYPNYGPAISSQCDNFANGGGTEYTVNGPNLFISKLNPLGTALLYSTFFGGSQSVYPVGLALDGANNIYFMSNVNGLSADNLYVNNQNSRLVQFPVTESAYQGVGINVNESAVSELSADGQTLLYSTFLGAVSGGSGEDVTGQAFALGPNGIAYAGGYTAASNFPTTAGSFKPACGLNTNNTSYCFTTQGFVAAIDTTKSGTASLVYASYLGGEEQQGSNIPEQEVYGLAADANNNLFVTGYTSANDFPSTAGVYQPHCNDVNPTGNCNQTAFLSKINPTGTALTWSTLLGDTRDGGPGSYGASIAFDAAGQVYLYGLSNDGSGSFPQVDPISTYTGGNKVFLATFSADATKLLFSTRFSGPSNNAISVAPIANGLAVDSAGSMYIVGYSGDGGSFGTTPGTYSTTATNGFNRAFFAKISKVTAQSATTLTISPSPASSGQTITFASAETGDGSTAAIPSGTVALTVSGVSPTPTVLGTITLDGTGSGTSSTNSLSSGTYSVQAAYSGDANFEPSQSAVQTLTVTAPITQNLLLNPGAELGSLADWTIGGNGTPQVDSGTYDPGINPHTGSYDFVGGLDSNTDSLSQTVSIVAQGTGVTAAQVDGGTLFAGVSFWEQGLNQGTPSDDGSVTLTFLDGNNNSISTVTTSTVDSHNGTWTNGAGTYAIPVGTRSITYTMNFMKNQLTDNDAFFDDNSLYLSTSTGLTLFPQSLHFGNVAVGGQSAPQTVTVTNQQTTTINILQIMSELGANPTDFVQTNNCPSALAAGASCQVSVTFIPDGVGPKLAGIDLPDDSVPDDQYIRADGTGTGGILQVNPGNLKTVAGNGTIGDTGDGGQAIMAELNQPNGVAFDPSGNLYIADDVANVVRKVDTTGKISTFAGTGTSGFAGDNGPAAQAELSIPFSVASDAAGNIYIQDTGNYVIRKVTASTGIITTFAGTPGTPGHSGDRGPATQARFNNNQGARFDVAGNFYVPTCRGASIRKIDTAGNISTVAGNFTEGYSGDGGLAINAQLQCPSGVAIDTAGNLYIADASNNVIRKVTAATGIISTIAGSLAGTGGSSGDGGAATAALLSLPNDVALDGVGNLYIADSANNRVRKIDTNGIITTVAGGLNNAGSAAVNTPLGLTTDTTGHVYFSDSGNGKIQEIFPQGTQPFPATQVGTTSSAQSLTLSNIGNVDVTLNANGAFTTSGNSGDFALAPGSCGNGTVLTANGGSCAVSITFTPTAAGQRTLTVMIADNALNTPQSFSIGGTGTQATGSTASSTALTLSSTSIMAGQTVTLTARVTGVAGQSNPTGTVTFFNGPMMLGSGTVNASGVVTYTSTPQIFAMVGTYSLTAMYGGDAAYAGSTSPAQTLTVTAASMGLQLSTQTLDFGNVTVGQTSAAQTATLSNFGTTTIEIASISPYAGANPGAFPVTSNCPGELAPSATCTLSITFTPSGIGPESAYDAVQIVSSSSTTGINVSGTGAGGVLQVNPGNLKVIAGNGVYGYTGDGSAAAAAELQYPFGITFDPSGNLYIADADASVVRKVDTAGNISTFAGNGTSGYSGDGAAAASAELDAPLGVQSDASGNIFIVDQENNVIRKVNASTGLISTFAGNGTAGYSGDGGAATAAAIDNPQLARFDSNGNLYITQCGESVVRKVDTDGNISTIAGNGTAGYSGDGGAATSAQLYCPSGVTIDTAGNLYITDVGNHVVRKVDTTGKIMTIAGTGGTAGYGGDGGPATSALLSYPRDVLMDGLGNLYVADGGNNRVREINLSTGIITTVAGGLNNAGSAATNTPETLALDANGSVYFTDGNSQVAEVFPQSTTPFPGTPVGSAATPQTLTLSNIGNVSLTIPASGAFTTSGDTADFSLTGGTCLSGSTLAPSSGTCTLQISFTPTAVGQRMVTVSIADNALNSPQSFSIGGIGTAAANAQALTITWATPTPITDTTQLSGTQLDATATDANGNAVPGTFVYTPAAGATLAPGTQTLSVTFTPTDTTAFTTATKTVQIVVNFGPGYIDNLSPSTVAFPREVIGTASKPVTISVSVDRSSGSSRPQLTIGITGDFSLTDNCDSSSNAACAIQVTFNPTATGTRTGTLTVTPTGGSTALTVALSGSGLATGTLPGTTSTVLGVTGSAPSYGFVGTVVGNLGVGAPSSTVSFVDTTANNAVLGTATLGTATITTGLANGPSMPTGSDLGQVTTADLNGDGKTDVVVLDFGSGGPCGALSIWLGNGDGTFTAKPALVPPSCSQVPNDPLSSEAFVIGDFNGDGHADIALDPSGTSFIVYFGNGDGTFTEKTIPFTSDNGIAIAAGDFNGDGRSDLVFETATSDSNNSTYSTAIALGQADGTFVAGATNQIASAVFPFGAGTILIADFNGDGNQDFEYTSADGVAVSLGNGDGTFKTPVDTTVRIPAGFFSSVGTGDFNKDNRADLLLAGYVGDPSVDAFLVLSSKGDGTFTVGTPVATSTATQGNSTSPTASVADFNGDGLADIAFVDAFGLQVFLNNGDGTYTPAGMADVGTSSDPDLLTLTAADFNGDGLPDLISADSDTNLATVTFAQRTETAVASLANVAVPGTGQHAIEAVYAGDTKFLTSTSPAVNVQATPLAQTITFGALSNQTYPGSPITLTATASSGLVVSYSVTGPATVLGATLTLTGVGSVTVTASQAGNATYAAAAPVSQTFVVTQAATAPEATTTLLSITAGDGPITQLAAGSVVTLTASVSAAQNSVTPGQVAFCDATAAMCTDNHLFATAQLVGGDTSSTATYKFVPGIGVHSYKAVFLGTAAAAGSASTAASLTVTGTEATATLLAATGVQGSYALTATVNGFGLGSPSGNVVFTDSTTSSTLGTVPVTGVVRSFVTGGTLPGGPITVGSSPTQVVSADVNGDGKPDLIVANGSGTMVTVLIGKGDGTYTALPSFGTNYNGITGVAVADFNGDGKLDIATANQSTVGIFLGNGDGTFGAEQDFANTNTSAGVFPGDFNGDGKVDLAVPDRFNGMTILIGNGDGTFTQPNPAFAVGASPNYHSAIADLNGDGILDIAAGNFFDNTVTVLLGKGDGTFQAPVTYATGAAPTQTFAADFNGDGHPDLLTTNSGGASVSVLLGNGDGTFQAQQLYPTGSYPNGAAFSDLNGDGKLDVVVTNQTDGTISILFGNGDGSFQTQQVFPSGNGPDDVTIVDANGDGSPDIAVANSTDNTVTVFLNEAQATASVTGVTLPGFGSDVVVAAYSGDALFTGSTSNTLTLASNTVVAPVITWTPTVATIVYGTVLGAQQLNATAATATGVAIPGTFVYTPAAGTVLTAGTHTLSVAFTPTSNDFTAATGSAVIAVTQATPVITWAAPAMIPYGTALGAAQLDAAAAGVGPGALAGTLAYTPAAGAVLAPGMQTLSVVFTPTDAVDYTTATASVQIVVGGLTLTSFTPVGVLIGSGDTTITLTGTGFVPTSMVMVNGAGVSTAYVSPTMLTAVIPAALLKAMGTLAVTVVDPSIGAVTVAQTFSVVPPTGGATLTGPATTAPGSQPTATLAITNPYPLALTAQFSLAFASAGTTSVDDPSIQFSTGGRTFSYTVAANSTSVPPVQLQAGTDAGTITITAKLMADGVDVTPTGLAPLVIVVPPVVPTISGTTITASGSTLTVVVHGFSNTREVSSAVFDFTAATGDMLATPSVTIPATTIFGTWYGDATSVAYGSTFTYTQVFNTSADAATIGSVKVTLTNSVGVSAASTSQ